MAYFKPPPPRLEAAGEAVCCSQELHGEPGVSKGGGWDWREAGG